jgi:hypothetical protein
MSLIGTTRPMRIFDPDELSCGGVVSGLGGTFELLLEPTRVSRAFELGFNRLT